MIFLLGSRLYEVFVSGSASPQSKARVFIGGGGGHREKAWTVERNNTVKISYPKSDRGKKRGPPKRSSATAVKPDFWEA